MAKKYLYTILVGVLLLIAWQFSHVDAGRILRPHPDSAGWFPIPKERKWIMVFCDGVTVYITDSSIKCNRPASLVINQ